MTLLSSSERAIHAFNGAERKARILGLSVTPGITPPAGTDARDYLIVSLRSRLLCRGVGDPEGKAVDFGFDFELAERALDLGELSSDTRTMVEFKCHHRVPWFQ